MPSIVEQLRAAYQRTGWTMTELQERLREQSGVNIERSCLLRRLQGKLRMSTDEAEALATCLQISIAFIPPPTIGGAT